jgi:hypothetical protein
MSVAEQRSQSTSAAWSAPYCSVQHLVKRQGTHGRWATVTNRGSFAELDGWYQGCQFSPHTATFHTIEEARTAGERWAECGVFPATDEYGWVQP